MSSHQKKVFVAMSGGVDSSVAALLLKKEGYDVTGVHMLCWENCENNEDKRDAMRVAAKLGISFLVWDFKKEYREHVFNYMVGEYAAGRTPNPDVMCNSHIKFGVFLERALKEGADCVATGHYVKIENLKLKIAKDTNKDQSYFLWTLTQNQFKHCLFPIGDYLKSEVRKIALEAGLPVAEKKDSQGLCFVGKVDFQEFLRGVLPEARGSVVASDGRMLGAHDGAHFYTIGQRHGLNLGGQAEPLFVAEKNISTNTLVVAPGQYAPILYKKELTAGKINWVSGVAPDLPLNCLARIRYRQPLQGCLVNCQMPIVNYRVVFNDSQRAVAPGQSIVFYTENSEMIGGGVIA